MQNLKPLTRRNSGRRNISKVMMIAAAILLSCSIGFAQTQLDVTSFGSGAAIYDPFQVWVSAGYAFVTNAADSVVQQVSLASGLITTLAGKAGEFGTADGDAAVGRLGQPAGVWSDGANVYVTDAYFDTIRQISLASGQMTTLAGSANSPSAAIDGMGAAARFRSPNGIWGDGTSLYVCDSLNFTVRKVVVATGAVTTLAGTARAQGTVDGVGSSARFDGPSDIWGDGVYLYVADGSAIRKVTIATGDVRTLSGSSSIAAFADGPGTVARFSFIEGIWGDGFNLFVADSGNDVIRMVSAATGAVTTVAGLPLTAGNANGLGQAARFDSPTDVAGDGATLYIVDRMNSNIRRATLPVAGNPPPVDPPAPPVVGILTNPTPGPIPTPAPVLPAPPNSNPGITPLTDGSGQLSFRLENSAGGTVVTSDQSDTVQNGYARLQLAGNSTMPSGLAIFGHRRNGVLVSETTVPVSQLIQDGRIPVEIGNAVNTGIAIANPNAEAAVLSFYLTDGDGANLFSGTIEVPGNGLVSAFLNESPFTPPSRLGIDLTKVRTFTFSSSVQVGVVAIRGFTNERSDFLVATLPVLALGKTDSAPVVIPYYAQGGGWKTQLALVNPTDSTISGVADVFTDRSQPLLYSIAPRSTSTLQLPGDGSQTVTGWIRIKPTEGMISPSGLLLSSFQEGGITVTQTSILALPESPASRLYVEASGDFNNRESGSIQTGFALSNSGNSPAPVNFELFGLDGQSTGFQTSITIPAYGHVGMFVDQLPTFQQLGTAFQGFLRVTGSSVSVVGLRCRYNERGEFLITPTTPASESAPLSSTASLFPLFVNGGGYTTQFILFNSTSGQVSNGTLSFVSPTGGAVTLPIGE